MCRIQGNDFGYQNFLYFIRSKHELESRRTGVGYKTPPSAEVHVRNDPTGILLASDLRWQGNFVRTPSPTSTADKLHPNSYGSRTSSPTSTAGKLRLNSYGSRTPSPTPTAGKLRPDSYGGRTSSPTSTAGRLRPSSYGSQTSPPTPATSRLCPGSHGSRTSALNSC